MISPEKLDTYIKLEQQKALIWAQEFELRSATHGDEYYHGYYNGYLTALINIKISLVTNLFESEA